MLRGKMQGSRIFVCSSRPRDSKNNLLDGETDEAISRCPQPCTPQELVGEEDEAAVWGWCWGTSSALPAHLPPTLMPPTGKNQALMHSPSGPKHPGHPTHNTSGIKRLLAAMPACSWVHLSHTVSPDEK